MMQKRSTTQHWGWIPGAAQAARKASARRSPGPPRKFTTMRPAMSAIRSPLPIRCCNMPVRQAGASRERPARSPRPGLPASPTAAPMAATCKRPAASSANRRALLAIPVPLASYWQAPTARAPLPRSPRYRATRARLTSHCRAHFACARSSSRQPRSIPARRDIT